MLDLSIIIVNWNTARFLRNCLKSIYEKISGINFEVFVVDNASKDNNVEAIKCEFPQIKLIKNKENLGFAKANNQAIRKAKGKYIFLLNPDTILINDAPKILIDFMEDNRTVGICGAKLLRKDMSGQVSYGNFPSLWQVVSETLFLPWILSKSWFPSTGIIANSKIKSSISVDYVAGASLMIRKEVIDDIGLFDGTFFLYFEETDLCYRARQSGWKAYYVPSAKIIHYGGISFKSLGETHRIKFYDENMYKFFLKHYGVLSVTAAKYLLLLGCLFRIVIWQLIYLTTCSRRENSKKRINDCLMHLRTIVKGMR